MINTPNKGHQKWLLLIARFMIFTNNLYPQIIKKGSNIIERKYIGKDLVFNYIDDPYKNYELILHLSGKDAPVSNNWICRVTGKRWALYGGVVHNSGNKMYMFENSNMYAQLADSVYDFGNHWICVVDGDFKKISNSYGLLLDFGSITNASKATSVQYGGDNGNRSSQNWKLFGNSSNPGVTIVSDLFEPITSTKWTNITMHQKIIDGGDGYDIFSSKINESPWVDCPVKIPKTDYNRMNTPWKINQGVEGSNYGGIGRYRDIKIYKID